MISRIAKALLDAQNYLYDNVIPYILRDSENLDADSDPDPVSCRPDLRRTRSSSTFEFEKFEVFVRVRIEK